MLHRKWWTDQSEAVDVAELGFLREDHLFEVFVLPQLFFNDVDRVAYVTLVQRALPEVQPRVQRVHVTLELLQDDVTTLQHWTITFHEEWKQGSLTRRSRLRS